MVLVPGGFSPFDLDFIGVESLEAGNSFDLADFGGVSVLGVEGLEGEGRSLASESIATARMGFCFASTGSFVGVSLEDLGVCFFTPFDSLVGVAEGVSFELFEEADSVGGGSGLEAGEVELAFSV